MVYQYHSDKIETYNKNILIEIQFRTKLQHLWATALEMMGLYTKTPLKASMGDPKILRFFVLVSSIFALREGMPVCPNTSNDYNVLVDEIRQIDKELNILLKLSSLTVAIKDNFDEYKEYKAKEYYFFLDLDPNKEILEILTIPKSMTAIAMLMYNDVEKNKDPYSDVVLVSASSFNALKTAYPNYFADINDFLYIMSEILK